MTNRYGSEPRLLLSAVCKTINCRPINIKDFHIISASRRQSSVSVNEDHAGISEDTHDGGYLKPIDVTSSRLALSSNANSATESCNDHRGENYCSLRDGYLESTGRDYATILDSDISVPGKAVQL